MFEYTFSLTDFETLIIILVRISCFVFIAPFFGTKNVPGQVKIGFSVFVSIIIYGFVDKTGIAYTSIFGYAVIILREGITGLLIGFAASVCNSIILFAGNMIDVDVGLAMATVFDPSTNSQVTITGNLYNYFVLLLLIATNMHHFMLKSIIDTYEVIPISGQVFDWGSMAISMTRFMTDLFVIAFRIILPVFACIMILNCILGIMAKVAPQMNMFAVGMQMKIMVGFAVLMLTIVLLPGIADFIFTEMRRLMVSFAEGMY